MRRIGGRLRPGMFALVVITLLLAMPGAARAGSRRASPTPDKALAATLVYHEITAFSISPTGGGEEAPILSDDGEHIAFGVAPGTEDPANPNRIFVMNADGSGQHEVDSYTTYCYCGSMIDISADGGTVISTDSVQLRIADGASGDGRELIALDSNEINAARISGDGTRVFFRVYRDTAIRGSSPSQPVERGLYVVNADGSGLRQIVGPSDMEALGLPPTDFFGSNSKTIDASTDGSHLIFGAYNDPKSAGEGNGLFGVDLDGSGLRDYLGRVSFLLNGAISGDGSTVAYSVADESNVQRVGVVPFTGGSPRTLFDSTANFPVAQSGIPDGGDRMQLSGGGGLALLGSSGVLADTETGDLLALGVPGSTLIAGAVPLVGDGLYHATMDAQASRFLYSAGDAAGVLQLATVDRDPTDLGPAPLLTEASIDPPSVHAQGGSTATVRIRVASEGTLAGVGGRVLRDGLRDPNMGEYVLIDDGSHGDSTAGDGEFTNDGIVADCCAASGPRTVRILAQVQGSDGKRHATAIDVGPFAVVAAPPTAAPSS
ncbi:MAG TPA: hypothetical protein VH482_09865 [Thermomicrobiales bacterium]